MRHFKLSALSLVNFEMKHKHFAKIDRCADVSSHKMFAQQSIGIARLNFSTGACFHFSVNLETHEKEFQKSIRLLCQTLHRVLREEKKGLS